MKLQALVRGYLVRKRAAATLQSMQALIRAQAAARNQRTGQVLSRSHRVQSEFRARKSMVRYLKKIQLGQICLLATVNVMLFSLFCLNRKGLMNQEMIISIAKDFQHHMIHITIHMKGVPKLLKLTHITSQNQGLGGSTSNQHPTILVAKIYSTQQCLRLYHVHSLAGPQ